MTVAMLAVIAVLVVASPFVERFLADHRPPEPDVTGPILATLLAQVQDGSNQRVQDMEEIHAAHLEALAELHELWAKRLRDVYDQTTEKILEAVEHERRSVAELLQWNRIERLDDVRARIATQQPTSTSSYGALSRVDMLREPSDVGERAHDMEDERLRPWAARRRAGRAMDVADGMREGRGSVDEYRDENGEPIVPVGMGG